MKQRRKWLYFVIPGLLFLSVQAAAAGDLKIAVVNFQKVFDESDVIKELNGGLEAKIKAEEEIISKKRDSLQTKKDELDKQHSMLSAEVRMEKEETLRAELKELQRYATDKQEEFQRKGSELMQGVMKELTEIVEEMGKKEKYSLVLERSTGGVVYFDSSTEITDEVVKKYDKKHKK